MSEETIFREVDEELRRDRLRTGWRRYGVWVIGAAIVVVLGVAAEEGWTWWQNNNAARSSDALFTALKLEDGGDLAGAGAALGKLVAIGSGQYPVLARFNQAGLLARQGHPDQALADYDDLANSVSNPRLKELALLFGANLLVDKGDVDGVKTRVEGMLLGGDPLRNAAHETLGLAQYKAGQLNDAVASFDAVVKDPAAPPQVVGRMQLYIGQLVAQGAIPPGAGAPPATAPVAPLSTAPGTAPAGAAAPEGVAPTQPSVPDAAIDMALPPPAAAPPAPADSAAPAPSLAPGAGLPALATPSTGPVPATATPPAGGAAPATGAVTQPSGQTTTPPAGTAVPNQPASPNAAAAASSAAAPAPTSAAAPAAASVPASGAVAAPASPASTAAPATQPQAVAPAVPVPPVVPAGSTSATAGK